MTTIDFKKLKNDPALTLRENERALMRARLLERMRATPAAPSPFMFLIRIRYAALAVVLVVSTTGVSFAAEGALPGEALYDFKVGVNERVEYLLAPGTQAKGTVAVRQAEERIREVEVLAVEGRLDAVQAERSALEAQAHIETAIAKADVLQEAGEELAAHAIEARLAATLSAHTELLEAQADALEGESADHIRALASALSRTSDAQAAGPASGGEEQATEYARAAYVRAKSALDELSRGIDDAGVPPETAAELSEEYERLSAEFALHEDQSEWVDAVAHDAYALLEKRAVRALTFLRAVRDIARETDKEVVLAFEASAEAGNPVASARMAKEASTSMMTTMLAVEEGSTTTEEVDMPEAASEPMLETGSADEAFKMPESRLQLWLRSSE